MKTSAQWFLSLSVLVGSAGCSSLLWAESPGCEGFLPKDAYEESAGGDGRLMAQTLTGPEGWEKIWSLPKTDRSPQFFFREAAGLSYGAITYPSGGGAEISPTDNAPQEIGRKLTKPLATKGNSHIYASFLMSASGKSTQGTAYALFSGIGGLGAGISEGALMVLTRRDAEQKDEGAPSKEWLPLKTQDYQPNTTYYFIVKISDGGDGWAADDEMEVWINPKDISSEEAATANALHYSADSPGNIAPPTGSIHQVILHTENMQGVTLKFDELRVGSTWASVTGPLGH